jgi:hypothetical protein
MTTGCGQCETPTTPRERLHPDKKEGQLHCPNISLSLHSSKLNANDFPEDVVVTLTTILQCQNQSFGIKFRCVSKAHKKEC